MNADGGQRLAGTPYSRLPYADPHAFGRPLPHAVKSTAHDNATRRY